MANNNKLINKKKLQLVAVRSDWEKINQAEVNGIVNVIENFILDQKLDITFEYVEYSQNGVIIIKCQNEYTMKQMKTINFPWCIQPRRSQQYQPAIKILFFEYDVIKTNKIIYFEFDNQNKYTFDKIEDFINIQNNLISTNWHFVTKTVNGSTDGFVVLVENPSVENFSPLFIGMQKTNVNFLDTMDELRKKIPSPTYNNILNLHIFEVGQNC